MTIYLVRHGKDDDGFRGGWSQKGLIEEGMEQSKKLGDYLRKYNKDFKISKIISSDLRRAVETAIYIADSLDLSLEKSEDWREINNGILAGMPNAEANKKFPGLYFNSLNMDERYPGGESPIENFIRIKHALNGILAKQINENHRDKVLIVTHGGVINIIYHILKDIEWTNKNKLFPAFNTSIHKIELVKDKWVIARENRIEHLF